jgi:hypothetical protein
MSELTLCNYCLRNKFRDEAAQKDMQLTILREPHGLNTGGRGFYIHPRDIKIRKLKTVEREKYYRGWAAEISPECVC